MFDGKCKECGRSADAKGLAKWCRDCFHEWADSRPSGALPSRSGYEGRVARVQRLTDAGLSARQIAERVGVSVRTVRRNRSVDLDEGVAV